MMLDTVPGCTVPWLPMKSSICTKAEDRLTAFTLYQDNRRNQHNICMLPCVFTNMYFGPENKTKF